LGVLGLSKDPWQSDNGFMNVVLAMLDSQGPSAYLILGLGLIFGSWLVRELAFGHTPQVADARWRGGVYVRVRSKKVVSIDAYRRASQRAAFLDRRAG
jgi:hypothetical protein